MSAPKSESLVYSTDQGRICPECEKPVSTCSCQQSKNALPLGSGKVRVKRETGGRGGKTVSTISGLALNQPQIQKLLSDLKKACGTGGTVKDGIIEIQGDHCDFLIAELAKRGIASKRAGG